MSSARPLFWRKPTDHPQDGEGDWVADGIGGRYSLDKQRDGTWLLWWAHDNFIFEKCATFAEGKQKAEADWQQRYADKANTPTPCHPDNGGFLGHILAGRVQQHIATPPAPTNGDAVREALAKAHNYTRGSDVVGYSVQLNFANRTDCEAFIDAYIGVKSTLAKHGGAEG